MKMKPAATVWKGAIHMGLVTIPVSLAAAVGDREAGGKRFHTCGARIQQPYYCDEHGLVDSSEVVLAKESDPDVFVQVDEPNTGSFEITSFLRAGELDELDYHAHYWLEPREVGVRGLKVLTRALGRKWMAVGEIVLRRDTEPRVAVIRMARGQLILSTLHHKGELRMAPTMLDTRGLTAAEMAAARELIDTMAEAEQTA